MPTKLVIDCSTGEVREEPLTDAELAEMAARAADKSRAWAELRARRNALLAACDWTQAPDAPAWVDKAAWAAYRQALRDLPANTDDPSNPAWPLSPQALK